MHKHILCCAINIYQAISTYFIKIDAHTHTHTQADKQKAEGKKCTGRKLVNQFESLGH